MLQGAAFAGARLHHATFDNADLDGADFRGAYGLTPSQILAAHHIEALYDPQLLDALKVQAPDRFVTYDSTGIEAETERERLSGELEPTAWTRGRGIRAIRSFGFGVRHRGARASVSDTDRYLDRAGHVAPGSWTQSHMAV